MYDSLVQSIQALQNSKYGKGNKKRLTSIHSALKQASVLFTSDNQHNEKTNAIISFRNIDQAEQIPKILEFVNDFEHQCLKKMVLLQKTIQYSQSHFLKLSEPLMLTKKEAYCQHMQLMY